ncbi:MAG TPA: cytochrome c biogenesis protein CcdA [Chloroflexota bacterium]|nr:cytochrome c biogenesis protein CcdA [Chloroflexota bacterium]
MAASAILGLAVTAAFLGRSATGQVGAAESLSSASTTFLAQIGTSLPFGYAFAAGMVAAANPCGFVLLPAYLSLYLGTERSAEELPRRLLRAAGIGLVVSASFVILFGAAGLVVAATTSGVVRYFPWIGLMVGVLLVAVGAATLGGVSPQVGILDRLGDRASAIAQRRGISGYAAYGVAYAAGSLGCTLPIFLSVVAAGMTTRGPAGALLQFVLYGLGMGSVLSALTLAAALVGHGAVRKVRRVGAYLQPVGAVVLLLAGGYVVYYWLTAGGIASSIG